MTTIFAALRESGFGTSRHFAAAQQFGRVWSEADINHRAGLHALDGITAVDAAANLYGQPPK